MSNNLDKNFEDAINATATPHAPWYAVPADNKWIMRVIVSTVITETIQSLDLSMPEITDQKKKELDEARKALESEG